MSTSCAIRGPRCTRRTHGLASTCLAPSRTGCAHISRPSRRTGTAHTRIRSMHSASTGTRRAPPSPAIATASTYRTRHERRPRFRGLHRATARAGCAHSRRRLPERRARSRGRVPLPRRLTVFALQWFLEFGDPEFPAFYRFDDDVVKWGAPNADNQYLRAKVAAGGTYRITAEVVGVREILISTQEGDMQLGRARVFD